jgi:hypothetical protein
MEHVAELISQTFDEILLEFWYTSIVKIYLKGKL